MPSPRILALIAATLLASAAFAQNDAPAPQARKFQLNAANAVILREVGAIISVEEGTLRVLMVPPADRRPEGMQAVDLQQGDEVGMANGKRVSSANDLRSAYEGTREGAEFKLGVRRSGRPVIVTFTRKGEKDMPGGPMIIRRTEGSPDADLFPALGFGLARKNGRVVVSETLPHAPAGIKQGDIVTSINGAAVKTVADFSRELDATTVGDTLAVVLSRDGVPTTLRFPRPQPKAQIRMVR